MGKPNYWQEKLATVNLFSEIGILGNINCKEGSKTNQYLMLIISVTSLLYISIIIVCACTSVMTVMCVYCHVHVLMILQRLERAVIGSRKSDQC